MFKKYIDLKTNTLLTVYEWNIDLQKNINSHPERYARFFEELHE